MASMAEIYKIYNDGSIHPFTVTEKHARHLLGSDRGTVIIYDDMVISRCRDLAIEEHNKLAVKLD